jgi:cell cycle protein kinase DBF2
MDEVTSHPFFEKTDWTNLRVATPPFVPSLDSEIDTGYYDDFTSLDDMSKYAEVKEKQRNVARVVEEEEGALKNRGVWVGFTFGKNAMTREARAVLADASGGEEDDTRLATIF